MTPYAQADIIRDTCSDGEGVSRRQGLQLRYRPRKSVLEHWRDMIIHDTVQPPSHASGRGHFSHLLLDPTLTLCFISPNNTILNLILLCPRPDAWQNLSGAPKGVLTSGWLVDARNIEQSAVQDEGSRNKNNIVIIVAIYVCEIIFKPSHHFTHLLHSDLWIHQCIIHNCGRTT